MHAADPREEARVRQTVIAFTINLDLLNFDALMLLFADELWIDYTSLWGGVPQVLTPRDLVAQLMGIAPGLTRAGTNCSISKSKFVGMKPRWSVAWTGACGSETSYGTQSDATNFGSKDTKRLEDHPPETGNAPGAG
ncbi:MAG: hypothetical protein WDM89_07075 [Rhizomicrobium sp.]